MTVNLATALTAYANAANKGKAPGISARETDAIGGFADLVKDAASSAVETGKAAEKLSIQAVAGKADLNEVVMAVSNAEMTLETVVTVRDRVIQAYQDIMRMPI